MIREAPVYLGLQGAHAFAPTGFCCIPSCVGALTPRLWPIINDAFAAARYKAAFLVVGKDRA